jgi:hypothetical protein
MFCLCLLVWKRGVHVLERLLHPRNMGSLWPNTTPSCPPAARLDNAATSYTAPPLHLFLFQGVYVKAWAGCTSSLTQMVWTPATPLIA